MKLFFFGNCILNNFEWNFRKECFDAISCIESWNATGEEVKDFISQVGHADALIMQPHSSRLSKFHDYKWIVSQLPNTRLVSLPSPHINSYNPLEFNPNSLMEINFDFHFSSEIIYLDSLMALYIIESKSTDISCSSYINFVDRFPASFWDVLAASSLNSMKKLENLEEERDCTVLLSQFVKDNFKNFQVMRTINHPSNRLCNFMIQAIAAELDLPQDSWRERYDYFPEYRSTIYKQIHRRLNLQFPATTCEDIDKRFNALNHFISDSPKELLNNLMQDIHRHLSFIGVFTFL